MKTRRLTALCLLAGIALTSPSGICQQAGKRMAITTTSEKARELFILGRDLKDNIEYVTGDRLLKKAIEIDPDFALAHLYLGTYAGTDKAMEQIKYVTPGEALLIRTQNAAFRGNPQLASKYADSLAALYPDDPVVQYRAGNFITSTNRDKGVKIMEKAVQLDENYAPAYNILGYFYMYDGNNELAGKTFKRYLELRPNSGNGHDSYGDFLQSTGKYNEAIEQYRLAFQNEPTMTAALSKTGWSYIRMGQFDKARKTFWEFEQAAQNDVERLDALFQLSLTSYVQGDMKQAFTELGTMKKKAAEVKNLYFQLWDDTYKGLMQLEAANPAGAIPYFRQALAAIPSSGLDSTGMSNMNFYHHGFLSMALALNGKTDEAQKEVTVSRQIFDLRKRGIQETDYMNLYQGIVEFSRKNYKTAIELMEPGALMDNYTIHQYYTGLAYDKSGNMDKAIKYYSKANSNLDTQFTAFYLNKTAKRLAELKKQT